MKARRLAVAALIAATGGFLRAESPAWSNEGPPFVVSALAVSPADGVVYAGTGHGLYVSSDRGRSWVRVGPDLPPDRTVIAVAPDPVRPGVLYLALDRDGVFKSENYGRSQVPLTVGLALFCSSTRIAVAPSNPSTVYISGCGISRSVDGGASWSPFPFRHNVYSLAVHPRDSGRILAGTDGGRAIESDPSSLIWASDDGGESWRPGIMDPLLGDMVLGIAFDPRNPSRVFAACYGSQIARSDDAGETWTSSRQGYPGWAVTSIAVDPTAPDFVYVPSQMPPMPPELPMPLPDFSGIYRSGNGGLSWSRIPGSRPPRFLAVDPAGGLVYAAGGAPGVDVYDLRADRPPILRPPPASRAPRTVVRPDGPVPKS